MNSASAMLSTVSLDSSLPTLCSEADKVGVASEKKEGREVEGWRQRSALRQRAEHKTGL